jgi:hypothetical protein
MEDFTLKQKARNPGKYRRECIVSGFLASCLEWSEESSTGS